MRTSGPRPFLLAVLVLTVVSAVYAPAFTGPFVWDDRALIFEDPMVSTLQAPQRYVLAPFWASGPDMRSSREFYRPLITFSFALDHAIHGENATGYHLTNLLAHLVACALLFVLLASRAPPPVAAALTLAWGLLPRLAESVAWIAGRTDVFATVFVLAALLVWRTDARARRWAAAALVVAGLFAKEVAIAALVALVVRCAIERKLRQSAPLWCAGALYAVARLVALRGAPGSAYPRFGLVGRAALVLEACGRYAAMLVDPWQPRTQIGLTEGPRAVAFVIAGAVVLAGLVGAAVFVVRRRSSWAERAALVEPFAPELTLVAVSLGLVVHVFPLPINVVAADRFLYLPTAACALVVARPLARAVERARWVWAPVVVAAAGLAFVTYERALDWSDDARLWMKSVRHAPPDNALPHNQLGNVYFRAGEYDKALEQYEASLAADRRIDDDAMRSRTEVGNIANSLAKLGRYEEALRVRTELVLRLPGIPRFHLDRAGDELRLGHFDEARQELDVASRMLPGWNEPREALGRLDELEREAPVVLRATHGDAAFAARRARLLVGLGRRPDAVLAWRAAIDDPAAAPDDVFEGAVYVAREGTLDEARAAVRRAVGGRNDARADELVLAFAAREATIADLRAAERDP